MIGRYERPVTGSGVIWRFPGSWNWLIGKAGSLAVNSRLRTEGGVSWVGSALLSRPESLDVIASSRRALQKDGF